ncbi:hypothetical protein MSG28_008467 [Choristoneura fumiferana]|uniref:Uncharacterized protein n=1 Tax=Choristoneura fumiferana TaxID=7141 RepID=A0ACC0J6U1_CHOFU|nr:hypothetical protein MSG28_008467 [Choristoneura fumiferana]
MNERGFFCNDETLMFPYHNDTVTVPMLRVVGLGVPLLAICRPSVDCSSPEWHSRYIQSSDYTCTGEHTERFQDIRVSFLSGHSSWSAFTMVFFALYLERRMTWRGTRVLRHTLQFTALMLSWFTALSRVSDFKHHWSDVLAGYFLGLSFAVIVWTWGTDLVQKKKHHSALSQHDVIVIGQVPDTA